MTDQNIEFVSEIEPRNRRPRSIDHEAIAKVLKSRPGSWAIVARYGKISPASVMSHAIRNSNRPAYQPIGSFESVSRTLQEGEAVVYARFVGEAQ
jgi:hypothetical protein